MTRFIACVVAALRHVCKAGRRGRKAAGNGTTLRLAGGVAAVIVLLNGCAAAIATSYAPATEVSDYYGYSEAAVAADTFELTFRGNEATSVERATDFVLLRGATVALENDCRYFDIVALDVASTDEERSRALEQRNPQTLDEMNQGLLSGQPVTDLVYDATAPTAVVVMACVEESSGEDASAFDARFVRDSVTAKYPGDLWETVPAPAPADTTPAGARVPR